MRTKHLAALMSGLTLGSVAFAAKTTILGINMASKSTNMIMGLVIAAAAMYNIYRAWTEGKGGNTALVLMAMIFGAFQNGGFNNVESAMNIMIAMMFVQFWFDMSKGDEGGGKLTMGGTGLRMLTGWYMVKEVASGMDPITAIMLTVLGYGLLNSGAQILYRKETGKALVLAWKRKKLDEDGKFQDYRTDLIWKTFLGEEKRGSTGGAHSSSDDSEGAIRDLVKELKAISRRIKPINIAG